MSQRGYGDPPYPPTDSGARQLSGSGSSRDLSAAYDRESAPIRTEARNQGSTDQGRPSGGGRRSEPDEARYEPPPSRSSRSRWSNPPPRRRRSNQASGYAPNIPSPTYRDDVGTDLDDPNIRGSASRGWDDYRQPTEWDEGAAPATSSPRRNRLGGQLRAPRLRLGGASRPRTTRSIRTSVPTFRIPNVFTRVELFHDQVALALLSLAVLSVLVMAGVVAGRIGNVPDVIALRYDATGSATRWGTPESLWELPLLAGMVALINTVLAWWLSSVDRFASRFMLATAVLVSVLGWVSLVRFLW